MTNKNKRIILKSFHFEIKRERIIFYGVRGIEGNFDRQRYEIEIHFTDFFTSITYLAKICKKRILEETNKMMDLYKDI